MHRCSSASSSDAMDAPLHRHACEVAFGDTDASGWMHFPNIFRYFEAAEHTFLKSRGVVHLFFLSS